MSNRNPSDTEDNLATSEENKRSLSWGFLLRLTVSVVILAFILTRIDFKQSIEIISHINLWGFVFAFLLNLLFHFLFVLRWQAVLSLWDIKPGLVRLSIWHLVGMFFSLFLPTSVGGDIVKAYYFSKDTSQTSISFLSVFWDKYIGFVAFIFYAALTATYELLKINGIEVYTLLIWVLVAAIAVLAIPASGLIMKLVGLLGKRLVRLQNILLLVHSSFKMILRNYRTALLVFTYVLIALLLNVAVNYVLIYSMGLSTDLIPLLILIPVITAINMLPISISGLGVREAAFILLFAQVGFTNDQSFALSILNFILLVLASLPGGLIYLMVKPKKDVSQ
ncbi:MAG: lysylphosphatidylglycerol synthase transmembrane domain-containing protein [Dehalococcoidia bacterium]|nr:lysylphosphatidylglycerol synthase transmembrane domain-containing protein [Dehalococcoidia bacterium]